MELFVDLGPMPDDPQRGAAMDGLRGLLQRKEMCDVVLLVGGQSLWAHRVVLAACSPNLRERLVALDADPAASFATAAAAGAAVPPGASVIRLDNISHPEAVQAMLECVYGSCAGDAQGEYTVTTDDVNRDVLWLAQHFQIAQLLEQASRWVLLDLTTSNLLRRLVLCEEFGLGSVRDKILEQLVSNPDALFAMARDPEITKVPAVLQDLLVRILKLLGCDGADMQRAKPQQGKHAKKAGA